MIITRSDVITVPQTEDGLFMAERYKKDMENAGMQVQIEQTTTMITVRGFFTGDLPDDYVRKLRERK